MQTYRTTFNDIPLTVHYDLEFSMSKETDLLRRAAEGMADLAGHCEQQSPPEASYAAQCRVDAASLLALADKWERAEPVYTACWNHGCNALCAEIDLWVNRCPHCGKPAPQAAMQEPKP